MEYLKFLDRIIDDGIEAAKRDYKKYDYKLEGAVAGFESCRGKTPQELSDLLKRSKRITKRAWGKTTSRRYWRLRCFNLEVEWVCNVLSAMIQDNIVPCTARGYLKALELHQPPYD